MREVVERRPAIAAAAHRHAPYRRSWALVGNGVNRIAAQELRIKLSELCYKSIACDATEDKKHIDLSAEPLILVCAAGLSGSNADDVGKELAIYRAHKAAAVVIATEGEMRLSSAIETISVPVVHPMLAFVVAAMAGHLFGYEAALAIDATAVPLREARALVETLVARRLDPDELLIELNAGARAARGPVLRRTALGHLRRPARRGHRGAARRAAALRNRRRAARFVSARVRQGRHAEHARRRPHVRAHRGDRAARRARSTRSSTRPRR